MIHEMKVGGPSDECHRSVSVIIIHLMNLVGGPSDECHRSVMSVMIIIIIHLMNHRVTGGYTITQLLCLMSIERCSSSRTDMALTYS